MQQKTLKKFVCAYGEWRRMCISGTPKYQTTCIKTVAHIMTELNAYEILEMNQEINYTKPKMSKL